jgi:hypothetical protein
LLALAAVLVLALRRASAAHRHLVWACALVGLVALPWMQLSLPAWKVSTPLVGKISPGFGLLAVAVEPSTDAVHPRKSPGAPRSAPFGEDLQARQAPRGKAVQARRSATPSRPLRSPMRRPCRPRRTDEREDAKQARPVSHTDLGVILLVWAIGALAVLSTFVAGHLVLRLMLQARVRCVTASGTRWRSKRPTGWA